MRNLLWILFIACIILDILLATWTWQEVRDSIGWVKNIPQKTDFKLRHIVQYSPQAFLLGLCLERFKFSLGKRAILAIIGVTLIGISTEVIQAFTPSRIPALMDIFWNFTAATIGAFTYYIFRRKFEIK